MSKPKLRYHGEGFWLCWDDEFSIVGYSPRDAYDRWVSLKRNAIRNWLRYGYGDHSRAITCLIRDFTGTQPKELK